MILTGITNSMNPDLKYFYGDMNIANYNNQEVKNKIKSLDTYKDAQNKQMMTQYMLAYIEAEIFYY